MSRYSHSHHNNHHSQSTVHRGRPVSQHEEALANNCFEHFLSASTLKTIFGTYRSICDHLHLKPNCIPYFYPKLKAHVNSWKAKPLWKKFDARANQKCYNRGKSCPNTRVLIIGAGPCGLRTAIEAQLLGAKVVVVEKRDRMTRNNVLHLWPFVIEDLRALGAKKFFGKFCAGAIDHISIRQLQCILLKVALLLGVEIHTEVSFERLIEPNPGEKTGWCAEFKPTNHPVNQFEFDVIIGADGKRNTLQGFKRKEFRGKLAIAITANFINKRTEAEARVEEISGVAFIFNQKFFKDLYVDTGIDLENIVYYKDDTHYFVMTAKKQSLIDKGVIRQDLSDTAKLLAPENVDRDELMNYAREAAEFSTNYQMPDLEFAVNHYGQPDVAMFDFTSMYAAENASRITELHGYRLLAILVGDSLLEPFWPTGSGCARGFLSSMDAAWAIRSWETATPLQVIAERESIYRLLAQTTPENLNKDYKSYTLDPTTRYPNLNKNVLLPHQVTNLFDTDNPKSIEIRAVPLGIVHGELPKKRRRRDSHVDPDTLLGWIQDQVKDYESVSLTNITTSFKDGRVLCAIIHHYRPDLLDYGAINPNEPAKNNQIAFDILEKELGIPPVISGTEMAQTDTPDYLTQLSYLTQIYDTFRCEIPHIKHPKLDQAFSLPRSSTCMAPYNTFPLRPILITPQSSAKVSEESWASHRISTVTSAPNVTVSQMISEKTFEDEVKESKSILLTDSDKLQEVKDVKIKKILKINPVNKLDASVKSETQISSLVENRGLLRKSKSSNLNSPVVEKREGVHTLKSLLFIRRKRCPKCMQRMIARNIAQNNAQKNNISRSKQNVENSGDTQKIKTIKPLKPTIKSSTKTVSKKKSVRLCSSPTQSKKVSIKKSNPRNLYKLSMPKEPVVKSEIENNQGFSCSTSVTPLPTDTIQDKTPHSSMAGSSEVALNFLKEMDDFLEEQNAAYEKINSLRVQILRHKEPKTQPTPEIIPPDIPKFLLESRQNRNDRRSDVIIIKNIERGNLGTISVEEVKVFSLDNSIKLVPRLISSTVTDYSTPFRSTDNQVSSVETSNKTLKCQQRHLQSFDKYKLQLSKTMSYNRGDKSESSGACKVEDWLVSSNFHSKHDNSRDYNDTTTSTDVETELHYRGTFLPVNRKDDKEISIIHKSKYIGDIKTFPVYDNYDEPIWKNPYKIKDVKNKNENFNNVSKDEIEIMSPKPILTRNPSYDSVESVSKFMEVLKTTETSATSKLSNVSPWEMYEGRMRDKSENEKFQTIVETEETDLPDPKRTENDIKLRVTPDMFIHDPEQVNRPPSRHKRSTDAFASKMLLNQGDRKPRKRKTMEKIGASVEERQKRYEEIVANRVDRHNKRRQQRRMQTEQFLKSMQMLQSNCKPDHSEPFEDYSIYLYRQTAPNFEDRVKNLEKQFVYVPDRENRLPSSLAKRETDEDFAARIKDMEQKWQETQSADKKPKDLLRAIGKIETSDWNIREIEKKIHENKMGKSVNKDKERVPKWSKEQFSARLTKMEKQHLDRQNSSEVKYAEIDKNIKQLDLKLKEGSALDLNQQKVASLAEKLTGKNEPVNPPKVQPIQKSNSRTAVAPSQNSEFCHFCQKRVYLMERLSAEGRFFHRGCFRCQYCQSVLRLGSYMFDREGIHGYRFYCTQHFGMPGELRGPKIEQKKVVPNQEGVSGKQSITGVLGLDLLDRVQTPERVEFANLSSGHISSDHEESPSPIDEDEWTDRNFRNSIIDSDSTDDSSSSSDTDSDDEEYEEALEEPITKEGNMKWAERYKKRYSHKYHDIYAENYSSSDHFSYDENSSGDDDSDTATEGEEEIRARELRKQEVRVEPPVADTGTDTEVNPLSILPKTQDPNTPDLLKLENNTLSVNKSSDNLSTNSNEFNSAESEFEDVNNLEFQNLPLRKSATTSSVNNNNNNILKPKSNVKPNFVIPPRKSSFGKEFIPTQDEKPPEPLLIIKRTPSKVNLPKEVGKPKVVVKADFSNAKKYFGDTTKKPLKPSQVKIKAPLVKQQSLPEKTTVKPEVAPRKESFNFEPQDCDMKDVDDYIENLLKHEDELLKPIEIKPVKQEESSESDEKTSNSIEDLLKALETETCIKEEEEEFIDVKQEEKIEDLLAWMEELDHQAQETEIASCESSSESSSEIQNSATEISTDSEFAHDEPTPTREAPKKMFDQFVTKTRGTGLPKKVQVKSSVLQGPTNNNGRTQKSKDIELKFTPLIPSPVIRKPPPISLFAKNEGYSLNRTQSTGGIATKVSLELKKKYLLGEVNTAGNIQKSGSASTLDSKFKSFHTNISDCQKLLKPAPEISASMQVFCNKLNERTSPLSPIFGGPNIFGRDKTSPTVELKSPNLNGLKTDVLPKLEITKCASTSCVPETKSSFTDSNEQDEKKIEEEITKVIINETEGRPRSPVHEKSIIVPVIDWEKNKKDKEKYVDSLSSTDSELDVNVTSKSTINNIPRLEVHDDSGAILNEEFDSLNVIDINRKLDVPKSINGEKKTLNQPKILPDMNNDSILPQQHSALHVKEQDKKIDKEDKEESIKSEKSSLSLTEDNNQAALTETELSDWARDGMVSDDLEDVDFDISPKMKDKFVKKVKIDKMQDHVCSKNKEKKQPVTECVNILSLNIENIEFMDTGTESSDDNAPTQNNGYVQFHNDDEFLEDSLSPVILINNIVETANPVVLQNLVEEELNKERKNSIEEDKNDDFKDKLKPNWENENDDSLVAVETGTTTEENTCSDSTVKVVTEINESIQIETIKESNEDLSNEIIKNVVKQETTALISPVLTELETPTNLENKLPSLEFDEHCQRLQSKIEFSNAKDSIDIRKTRRKSKPDVIKPDLIQEEKKIPSTQIVLPFITTIYKKEEIEKERNLNQKLVQEMVMNKMKAQNKSLERKKRSRNSFSPIRPFELTKSATTDITSQIKSSTRENENLINLQTTPDVLLSTINPLQKSQSTNIYKKEDKLPDISQINDNNEFKTPKAPPRTKCDEAKRTAEKLKQDARARVRLLSDEDLGLSPEDKLVKLRQKANKKLIDNEHIDIHIQDSIESLVINRERRNSLLYNNDTLKRNTSFRRSKSGGDAVTQSSVDLTLKLSPVRPTHELSLLPMRTKSVSEINRPLALKPVEIKHTGNSSFCKSDPNLLTDQKKEKKSKDRERRKSITKFITDMFTKKKDNVGTSPPGQSKGFLSRISPKSKTKSKDKLVISPLRRNSISEVNLRRSIEENIPPPIPPLPKNYIGMKDESSDGELDLRKDLSSCDTLDQSGITEESSFGRRPNRSGRKNARQAQLKRHRMAQEIQRKLEETEVKTRELELRGVMVEKALRGETKNADDMRRDEADLLKEWFDLMRERTELGRYEKELMIRAQELELEDRHARLQHDLRERLEREEPKSKEEVEIEGSIIKEMMEIVAKRDSLISVLEEDRLRHCEEDRDFEEKMLAKGIHLTPLLKTFDK